ncbi:MAG: hypothetical protein JW941_05705, partial [Candidatus Coatesbacteria bacterium]|nr:hypothetical protein [Candidatus Coatesbacteria bacterium]
RAFVGGLYLAGFGDGKVILNLTLKIDQDGRTARPLMVIEELYGVQDNILYFSDIERLEQYCWRRGSKRSLLEIDNSSGTSSRGI